ncbi:hypothetical protein [Nocardiopsis quinghaiensis]|uniref:hypothetical protein n=1 Tax=Nocardiopsis quinghaiensis TaxID=464995 RepID=UPI00123A6C99|nr:hypothetical protein [Nocardiopsis quinghaiensis]
MSERPITVHVASVGVSLFDNVLTNWSTRVEEAVGDADLAQDVFDNRTRIHDPEGELPDTQDEADRVSEQLVKELSERGQARENLESLVQEIGLDEWPRTISAELTSLASNRRGNHQVQADGNNDETVLLVASDTGRGLRAALFNALAMTGGDIDRVDYLPTTDSTARFGPGRVVIVRLPGLDAEDNDRFLGAMRQLGSLGPHFKELLRHPESTCRFHLTGGFRVAIPFLIGFAEALRCLYGSRISAHAQYEFSASPRSIELPLSSPRTDDLEGRLAGSGDDGYFVGEPPHGAVWEGFAYEYLPDELQWRLTPFGTALRELVPATKQEP